MTVTVKLIKTGKGMNTNMKYKKEVLLKVQALEKMILQDFHNICKKHGADYFIMYGSGIGVERHKDMIPWDDDIDVGMLREDFNKIISVIKKDYSDKYEILNFEENNKFPIVTTQIILKGTKFRVKEFKEIDCNFGIYLDVFPFDYVSNEKKEAEKQMKKAWFYNKLLILRNMGGPKLPFKGWKNRAVEIICNIIHGGLKLFHINPQKIYKNYMKQTAKYKDTDRIGFFGATMPGTEIFYKKDIFPVIEKPFGDSVVKVPYNNDKILRHLYGDYMKLPAKEDRVNHCPIELDFGAYK